MSGRTLHQGAPAFCPSKPLSLIGFMATGKTTIGKLFSERHALPFIDLDNEIEHREGKSISEIFAMCGEEGFRKVEQEVLKEILNVAGSPDPYVLACGGGIISSEENCLLLRERTICVHLDSTFACCLERMSRKKEERPLAKFHGPEQLEKLYLTRMPLYQSIALFHIDATNEKESILATLTDAYFYPR
ncbi:MAG: shikimate kinase [Candidatus Ozemobacteraceae bacterium]